MSQNTMPSDDTTPIKSNGGGLSDIVTASDEQGPCNGGGGGEQ